MQLWMWLLVLAGVAVGLLLGVAYFFAESIKTIIDSATGRNTEEETK